MSNIDVRKFDRASLAQAIADCNMSITGKEVNEDKWFSYLFSYLSYPSAGFKAKIFIIEPNYVSEAYLGDYLSHYSTKFKEYPKFTYRIHFFDSNIDAETLSHDLLHSDDNEKLDKFWEKCYIGYTVIKPVTNSIFGATLLKPYEDKTKILRKYPVTTLEEIHFLGRTIKIRALGYQQQDVSVGVCATNSLWCAFHKTSRLFGTDLPSPHNITKSSLSSTGIFDDFENAELGLTFGHIAQAIRSLGMGLDRLYSGVGSVGLDHPTLRKYVYGYCKAEIPVLLGYQRNDSYHLVTICGYRLSSSEKVSDGRGEFVEFADRIDRLYVHDDLIGPYAKMTFEKESLTLMKRNDEGKLVPASKTVETFTTHYIDGIPHFNTCIPNMLIIPLDKSISVKLEEIRKSVRKFHKFFVQINLSNLELLKNSQWEIYLQSGIDYKKEFKNSGKTNTISKIMGASFPLYVWIGRLIHQGKPILDIVYDASDDNNSFCCFQFNVFDDEHKAIFYNFILMELRKNRNDSESKLPQKQSKDSLSRRHINFMILALIYDGLEMQYYGKFNLANQLVDEIR
ncbi:MAG: hypothetical protein K9J17_02555 [Flavobacteriales bacterium]|nr:hypothetical protein [Flavobacteriales bacterium]